MPHTINGGMVDAMLNRATGQVRSGGRDVPTLDLDLDAEGSDSLDSLVKVFWTIEEALGDDRNVVRLPCRLFLENLPESLRGPRWTTAGFPEVVVDVDPWDLLCKIKMGRVTYPLARILADIPAGWMCGAPDAEVPLDTAKVLAALPEHLRATLA